MDRSLLKSSYAKSLLWLAVLVAVTLATSMNTELVFVDFIHGNPNRPQSNAITMMYTTTPFLALIAMIGVFLVFSVPQGIQALENYLLAPRFGRLSYLVVLLTLPLTAVGTWYCYDYFTPSDFNLAINEGPDWVPYQHGMTMQRYFAMLAVQAAATVFTTLYCLATEHRVKGRLIMGAVALSIVAGVINGHRMAEAQYQFIDHPSVD